MVKIQARKEKRIPDIGTHYVWDVWVDTTIETTYVRHYTHTARLLEGMSEEHADKVVKEINQDVNRQNDGALGYMHPRNKDLRND